MNALQPNFEKIKTVLYQTIIKDSKADHYVLFEQVASGKMLPSFQKRKEDFQSDLNDWLNNLDIRASGLLINAVVELGGTLPSWMISKKFVIDYNEHECLDIQKCSFVTQSY